MEIISTVWAWLTTGDLGVAIRIATAVLTAATAITAVTATTWDNRAVAIGFKILNFLAGNVLKNKNADSQ